ncbi:unnamed protein product [Closterium sp. Naga37s-1]|nr:unnamed protein product [Closterium sp. Naga37s-1]
MAIGSSLLVTALGLLLTRMGKSGRGGQSPLVPYPTVPSFILQLSPFRPFILPRFPCSLLPRSSLAPPALSLAHPRSPSLTLAHPRSPSLTLAPLRFLLAPPSLPPRSPSLPPRSPSFPLAPSRSPSPPLAVPQPFKASLHIVRLRSAPAVGSYRGGINGYPATAPSAAASSNTSVDSQHNSTAHRPNTATDAPNPAGTATPGASSQPSIHANASSSPAFSAAAAADAANGEQQRRRHEWRQQRRQGKVDIKAEHVQHFAQFLREQQQAVAAEVGVAPDSLAHHFSYSSHAFAALLTPLQVWRLSRHPAVAAVQRGDDLLYPQTTASSRFLRLPSTAWVTAGGADAAGEDVVIGVADSGIWPEHDSFSSKAGDLYGGQPVDYKGVCTVTSDFPACNTKVLGARYIYQGLVKSGRAIDLTVDYLSPRDVLGHGSCASEPPAYLYHPSALPFPPTPTSFPHSPPPPHFLLLLPHTSPFHRPPIPLSRAAAGNRYIKAVGGPFTRPLGAASGMAPRARIAVYKVVWRTQLIPGVGGVDRPGGVASLVDVEAAVDYAIQDNIDVLLVPLSAGFSPTASYFDHVSYLNAFEAGVTVVKPSGNRGLMLGVRTIENYSPFYLTVGASSISRSLSMDGARIKGYFSTAATTSATSQHQLASTPSSSTSSPGNASLSPASATRRRQHASLAALASALEGVRLTGDWSRAQFHPMAPAASAALSAAARKKVRRGMHEVGGMDEAGFMCVGHGWPCMPGLLNPLLALGKVLVCGPGGTTRQKKIAAAARAGARGVVLTYADADGGEEDEGEGGGGVEEGMGEEGGSGEGSGGLGGEVGGMSSGANGVNSTGGGSGDSLRGRSTVEGVGGAAGGARDMAAAGVSLEGTLAATRLSVATGPSPLPLVSFNPFLWLRLTQPLRLPIIDSASSTSPVALPLSHPLPPVLPRPARLPHASFSPLLWLRFLQPLRPPVIDATSSTGPVALPLARPGGSQPTNDLLKPDLIAPGVMLWAAAPGGARTNRFRRLSGTSMAAAHVAGVLALVIQENPTWLPGRVMSAVLTTAKPTNVYGRPIRLWNGLQADPWMMGSGHVNPSKVLDPGLTFDLIAADFKNLLAGQNPKRTAKIFPTATLEPIDAIQLNRPSIAISHCAGTVTVARTVTNVGIIPATFVAKVKAPFLTLVEVVPPRITLSPGDSYRFLVVITGFVESLKFGHSTVRYLVFLRSWSQCHSFSFHNAALHFTTKAMTDTM